MAAKVGIVGYKMGNITSLRNAFAAVGASSFVAEKPEQLRDATHIVLPGVGAFPMAMDNLKKLNFEEELRRLAQDEKRPLLGVCLGMQLLASVGDEHRVCNGLDLIPGRVTRFKSKELRVPHVGWNPTVARRDSRLLGPAGTQACFYFVHSYQMVPDRSEDITMTCDYGGEVAAGVERDNIMGVQFHPEKSHRDGLLVLTRFVEG